MRYIGVDLHTTQITVCYLKAKDEYEFRRYALAELDKFVATLSPEDEMAVEATANTRHLVSLVKQQTTRVVIVNPREFAVVKASVKKTDKRDALNLARFLQADLVPEVREKSELAESILRMNETRSKLVGMKTALLNKIHALAVSRGRKLKKESLSSKSGLRRVLEQEWTAVERLEIEIIIEQIGFLKQSIKRLDAALEAESEKLPGYENLVSISDIGKRSAGVLLLVIGAVAVFSDEGKLASYFGIVPKVANSNEKVNHGRITKRGSRAGRTTLVQCTLVAISYSAYLKNITSKLGSGADTVKRKLPPPGSF